MKSLRDIIQQKKLMNKLEKKIHYKFYDEIGMKVRARLRFYDRVIMIIWCKCNGFP